VLHPTLGFALLLCVVAALACACTDDDDKPNEGATGVYIFDLTTGALERISDDPAYAVAWAADGQTLWYSTNFLPAEDADSEVRAIDLDTRESRRIFDLEGGGFASLAPDAGRVAYVRNDDGELRVTSATSDGDPRDHGPGIGVELSPRGNRLIFLTPPCDPNQALSLVELDSDPAARSVASGVFAATWLRDGRIAYSERAADEGLPSVPRIFDSASGTTVDAGVALGFEPQGAYYPSPDGAHVLYGGDVNRVLLRDITARTDLDLGAGRAALAHWSPDSQLIAYAAFDVLHIATATGEERFSLDLTQVSDGAASPIAIGWSGDGARLALTSAPLTDASVCESAGPPVPAMPP
jgi:hypothetical protein